MSLLVVGSVAFDSIETPHGNVDDALGGSASFFSVVASNFTKPRLVGVVGEDFPQEHKDLFKKKGIDISGLVTEKGKTFRWKGRYHKDMNTRDTLEVHLNVFGTFNPILPDHFKDSKFVFLANSSPVVQAKVLDQVTKPDLVLADTMDLWINIQKKELLELLPRIDGLLLNDSEAMLLTGESNLVRAGHATRKLGPKFVILKKGEHGALLFHEDQVFFAPALPLEEVFDPTGAGDTFAGGFSGFIAQSENISFGNMKNAIIYGSNLASFCVEKFGTERMLTLEKEEVYDRLKQFRALTQFDIELE